MMNMLHSRTSIRTLTTTTPHQSSDRVSKVITVIVHNIEARYAAAEIKVALCRKEV